MLTTQRRHAALDDDDSDLYDPKYFPRKVVRDGAGVRVRLALTDGMPDGMQVQAAERAAEQAYNDHKAWLRDAWRTMPSGTGGAAKTTAPEADKPGDDDETLSPRDAWIRRMSKAYRAPPGQPDRDDDDAAAIEAQREAWSSPGAKPGGGFGDAPTRTATRDAVADRDAAYREYLARLVDGWRR
jgi:hypothetical protein